jgi:hypothetical protein
MSTTKPHLLMAVFKDPEGRLETQAGCILFPAFRTEFVVMLCPTFHILT